MSTSSISPYFDSDQYDIVLVSADDRAFHLTKSELAAASSFFADMFSVPQAKSAEEGVQRVSMVENGQDLEIFLHLLLTEEKCPENIPFDDTVKLFALADKFMAPQLYFPIADMLFARRLPSHSLELWAYCTIYGMPGLASTCIALFDQYRHNDFSGFLYPAQLVPMPLNKYTGRATGSRPLSPTDLSPDLMKRLPQASLIGLMKCYDLVAQGYTWKEATDERKIP